MVRFLKQWFGSRRASGLPAAPLQAPDWDNEHATALRKFLSTETGQVLIARGRALECATALKACQNQEQLHPQRAAGFSDCLNWIGSLSVSLPRNENEENEPRQSDSEMPGIEFATT